MNYRILKFLNKRGVRKSSLKRSVFHRWTGGRISRPELWKFSKASVLAGWIIGTYSAFNPIPGCQILMGLPFAFKFRANLFVVLALVFSTNPITTAPLLYVAYLIGRLILGQSSASGEEAQKLMQKLEDQSLWEMLISPSGWIWEVLLGGLILASLIAFVGALLIQVFWKEKKQVTPAAATGLDSPGTAP